MIVINFILPGTLFQELKEEMENVYTIYCSNYDQALPLLDTYRKDPRLQKQILDTLHTTVYVNISS